MKTFFVVSALAEILFFLALYLMGRAHVLGGLKRPYAGPRPLPHEPSVSMIVPITGDSPAVRAGLASLLGQDYPNLRYVIVTRDESDPATGLARRLIAGRGDAVHLISGPALACGQKNHNLLAGVAAVRERTDIFVFCDSSHVARPDLVRLLVEPIADGRSVMSGGFHRVAPLDGSLPTLGMLHVCMFLHCLQPVRAITQPWGGAMAIARSAFEEHGVAEVWSRNIVDDFSLGPHLAKRGIRSWPVAEACLDTPLKNVPTKIWLDWVTRQLLYLKFCTPEMWIGALVVLWLFSAAPLLGTLGAAGALVGLVTPWWLGAAAAYAAAFTLLGLLFRALSPRPVGFLAWTLAFFVSPLATALCYLRTWTTFTMKWRGIAYKVTWGGRVVEIFRR